MKEKELTQKQQRWLAIGEYEDIKSELQELEKKYYNLVCTLEKMIPPCDPKIYRPKANLAEAKEIIDEIQTLTDTMQPIKDRLQHLKTKWNI